MAIEKSLALGLSVSIGLAVLGFSSCHTKAQPVVVNVLRQAGSTSFHTTERRLLRFESLRPTTSSGRPVIVQSILMDQPRFLETLSNEQSLLMMKPDLVVLDSPEQARQNPTVQRQVATAPSACDTANCPVFITAWVTGEQLEASERVLKVLSSSDKAQ